MLNWGFNLLHFGAEPEQNGSKFIELIFFQVTIISFTNKISDIFSYFVFYILLLL